MAARDDFRAALMDGDVRLLRRIWARAMPHLPQPKDAADAEVCLHVARTATKSIPLKLRAYSHRWLVERELPSQLPDELKPEAERLYPKIAASVGYGWNSNSTILKPAKPIIERAVGDRIEELAADGQLGNIQLVRDEMRITKDKTLKSLFGIQSAEEAK